MKTGKNNRPIINACRGSVKQKPVPGELDTPPGFPLQYTGFSCNGFCRDLKTQFKHNERFTPHGRKPRRASEDKL